MTLQKKSNLTLKGKNCLTLSDFSSDELFMLIELAAQLKKEKFAPLLPGKSLGMIFEKPSTRTRVSFEVGMTQLGGHALYLNGNDLQIGRGESMADTAKVLSRYVDAIMIRTFEHQIVEELAEASEVPVINGLTNEYHPCQVLADLLTIKEKLGSFAGKTLVYTGDGNNMAHSLMIGAAKIGMNAVVASPKGFGPDQKIVEKAQKYAFESGAFVKVVEDPSEAVHNADIIYTDVWASMGDDKDEKRMNALAPFQVNLQLFIQAKPSTLFMHCLPAHRGEEVTGEIIDGPSSIVFDQAENRLHAQKALLVALMG
ncbi:MAG TPA: ornithine carbamoyltransferase [Bacillales bacterium]|nr:ornithine carbamoyltransferase [Bacillales bacterium]